MADAAPAMRHDTAYGNGAMVGVPVEKHWFVGRFDVLAAQLEALVTMAEPAL